MVKEMKKRIATTLYFDVSYKEAKRLHQYKGTSIFKGLAKGTNFFDEVRLQFYIVTDLHNQMESAISVYKDLCASFGYTLPKLVFTDDSHRDKNFFYSMLPTLKDNNFTTNNNNNNNSSNKHASRDITSSNIQTAPTQFSIDNCIYSSNYNQISSISSGIKEQI